MKAPLFLVSCCAWMFCGMMATAELPTLSDKSWFGFFAAHEGKKFKLGISSQGQISLVPFNDKGAAVSKKREISIDVGIEELLPDGKTVLKRINPETLESSDPATSKLVKTTIRGKVTGDAAFEAHIAQDRGVVSFGGRVTDPGTLTKNPIRFVVRVRFPSMYEDDEVDDKKSQKAFQEKVEDDQIELKWIDGKRVKQSFEKEVDATSKDMNGPGIAAAMFEAAAYKDRKILFTSSENSAITLWNSRPMPLHLGFCFKWLPDPAKDKDAKARLSIDVK